MPINLEHQHLPRFAVSPTDTYQFQALPFGLSSAPQIFMMVLRDVAQYDHHRGIKFHYYLDYWLIRHRNPAILSKDLQFVLDLATHLGWLVNLMKSDLVPSQQFFRDHVSRLALCCGCWAIWSVWCISLIWAGFTPTHFNFAC